MDAHGETRYNWGIRNGRALLEAAPTVSHDGVSVMTTPSVVPPCDSDNLKRCSKCHEWKPLDAFHKSKSSRDGLKSACAECRCSYEASRRAARSDEIKQRRRDRYATDPEYRAEAIAGARRRALKNKDQVLFRQHQWYEANKPRLLDKARLYRAENLEAIRSRNRAYMQTAQGRAAKTQSARRRRTRVALRGSYTGSDIEAIRAAQGNRCYLCGKKLKKYHIDHFIPLAKGGTNDPGNLRLACPKCNLNKGAKHPFELGRLL